MLLCSSYDWTFNPKHEVFSSSFLYISWVMVLIRSLLFWSGHLFRKSDIKACVSKLSHMTHLDTRHITHNTGIPRICSMSIMTRKWFWMCSDTSSNKWRADTLTSGVDLSPGEERPGEAIERESDGMVVRSRPRWEMPNAALGSARQCLQPQLIVLVWPAKRYSFALINKLLIPHPFLKASIDLFKSALSITRFIRGVIDPRFHAPQEV